MADDWANVGRDLHLVVDRQHKTDSLERALRDMIRDGRLVPGTRLPATRGLARDLGIARNSVAEVYERLSGEGWLDARVGAGTWVASPGPIDARRRSGVSAAASSETSTEVPGNEHPGSVVDDERRFRLDLRAGIPDTSDFPRSAWAAATRRALAAAPSSALGYGDLRGVAPLRHALATYLGRARGVVADPVSVHVTHGAGHAVRLVCAALRARGARRIAVEEYGHQTHRDILTASGLEVVPLPVDGAGAMVDALGPLHVDAVLLTPAHQFPTGVALSPARRAAAVAWAERTGGIVIEDDYDGEFRFDRRAVGALQSLSPDHVVFVGTASKALGPAVGLAWSVVPRSLGAAVAEQRRLDGTKPGAITQLALADYIEHGDYDRTVRSARGRYRDRRQRVERRIAERMPEARLVGMAAGLHSLLELPAGIREADVSGQADAVGLAFAGLQSFRASGVESPSGRGPAMVVGFGAPPPHLFDEAIEQALAAIERAGRDSPDARTAGQ